MTIHHRQNLNPLSTDFTVYRPTQIARLSGLMSLLLHIGIWQAWQSAALKTELVTASNRFEVALMAPVLPPKPAKIENTPAKKIQAPVSKAAPVVKPKIVRKSNQPATPKIKPPIVKPVSDKEPAKDTGPVALAVGDGAASQPNQGAKLGIGSGSGKGTDSNSGTYIEANFKANYAINPKPVYPEIAKSRGWQGTVLLKVKVTVDGRSEAVTIHRSSGYKLLDTSAVAAVEKWRFLPAKRGNTPVACTVIVPIVFALS